ncbi:hypothetical protein BDR05DRAFT_953569 [Suillus weaverae]|nr:hypothetical protein BDR05DRAFT_953569 [Suillus weaverae]
MQRSLLLIALASMVVLAVAYPMSGVAAAVAKRDSDDVAVAAFWPITYYGDDDDYKKRCNNVHRLISNGIKESPYDEAGNSTKGVQADDVSRQVIRMQSRIHIVSSVST